MASSQQTASAPQVKVSLLLKGGHEYTLSLRADDPTLRSLVGTVVHAAKGNEPPIAGLFQIPVDQGQGSVCFPSSHLVGIVTEPPMTLQMETPAANAVGTALLTQPPAAPAPSGNLPADYWQIDQFLSEEEHRQLLNYALQHQSSFDATTTTTNADDHRRSQVLFQFPEFSERIRAGVRSRLLEVCNRLNLPPFEVDTVEAQMTVHNDGDYYRLHNDGGSAKTATRTLTYVYYFYREPKPFCGGELLVYDTKLENNAYKKAGSYKIIEPRNNSIVFFPSRCLHEVLPIRCPSGDFADSRFTVNGWVRRLDETGV